MKNASMKNSTNKQRNIVRKYKKLQSFDKKIEEKLTNTNIYKRVKILDSKMLDVKMNCMNYTCRCVYEHTHMHTFIYKSEDKEKH